MLSIRYGVLIRSTLFYMGYIVSLILIGLLSVFLLPMPQRIAAPIVLVWNRFVLFWLGICCGIQLRVEGDIKTIPMPCVVVANHQSPLETIFLQLLLSPLTTVLKRELLHIPFFGWGLRLLKPIAIDRSNPVKALKQIKKIGIQRLQQGQNILIFPEGTRQPIDKRGHFARSGADIAKAAGVPLVVISHNSGHYWPNKRYIKYPGTVKIIIREAINLDKKTNTKEKMDDIKQWIDQKLDNQ